MAKDTYIVKTLTGGMDLDNPLQEIKKDCTMDAQNVSMSTFTRRRGDLIPSLGTSLANYSIRTNIEGATIRDAVERWENFDPAVTYSFFYPDMIFLGGEVTGKDRTILYAVVPEKNNRQKMINTLNDGLRYNVYELYSFPKKEFLLSHNTACEGFSDSGVHTIILTSHDLDLTFLQLNPEDLSLPTLSRMSDNAYADTMIRIDSIIHSPSTAIPSVTIYTARIKTQHGVFTQYIRPSEPVSIPYAYPSEKWEDRKKFAYEELQAGGIYSNTQVQFTIFLDNYTGGELVYVYAVRFRSSDLSITPDVIPIIQEIAVVPFPTESKQLVVKDGNYQISNGVPITWAELAGKLNYYNTFRAATLCVKRNVLFAGNIIDEKPTKDESFNARVFQFNSDKKAMDDGGKLYTSDSIFYLKEFNEVNFFQTSFASYNGDDMAVYEGTPKYCMYNLDGKHGASGENIDITFATGEQLDGEVFAQAADIENLHDAAMIQEAFNSPETRFSVVAMGASHPSHGDGYDDHSLFQEHTIDGRLAEKDYEITSEDGKLSVYTMGTGGHTHKNPCFNTIFKSMQHDSVYRLGLMLIYEDSTTSEMFYMGEIRTPSMNISMYRLFDSSQPIGVSDGNIAYHSKMVPNPKKDDKNPDVEDTIEAYKLAICNELTLYPLYMHVTVRNLPVNVVGVRFYYGDRLAHDARNVEQTGVFTKLLPPLRHLECTSEDGKTRGALPIKSYKNPNSFNEFYYDRNIYSMPPLPFVATHRHFYGGIIDQVEPNDIRQICINVPDGIDFTLNQSKNWVAKWNDNEGWCHFFIGRALQFCDTFAEKPEDPDTAMPEMYMFYSPETDLHTMRDVPFSVVYNKQPEEYVFQTHGFLTSIMPAGKNRGLLSAVYTENNDNFNHFFSMEWKKSSEPFESGPEVKANYRILEDTKNYTPGNELKEYSLGDLVVTQKTTVDGLEVIKQPIASHSAWPRGWFCEYDSLYMHNNFCPTFKCINPTPERDEWNYPDRTAHACMMSTLVSQEGLQQTSGLYWKGWAYLWGEQCYNKGISPGVPIGYGASRRTLKYYLGWDTYTQSGDPDTKIVMRKKKIEPKDIRQLNNTVRDFDSQFAFLFPCSFHPVVTGKTDVSNFEPVQIDKYLYCNIVPLYTGKILADKKTDLIMNDLSPYFKKGKAGCDPTVLTDLLSESREILRHKEIGGLKWVMEDTVFMTNLHSLSCPRIFNHYLHGGDKWSQDRTRSIQEANYVPDAGLIPFAEHGQSVIGFQQYVSLTNYYSSALVKRSDVIWYPGKDNKSPVSLTSHVDLNFVEYEKEFILYKPQQMPPLDHLIFPSVTWCDWPNAFGYDSAGHCRIDQHIKDMILDRIGDKNIIRNTYDWSMNNIGTDKETHSGLLRTGDYFTGLNHHGWGGRGVLFSIDQLQGLPYTYEDDKFQVPYLETRIPSADNKTYFNGALFFIDSIGRINTYSPQPQYEVQEIKYSELEANAPYYFTKDEAEAEVNQFKKGAEKSAVKIEIPENTAEKDIFWSIEPKMPVGRENFTDNLMDYFKQSETREKLDIEPEIEEIGHRWQNGKPGFYTVPAWQDDDFDAHIWRHVEVTETGEKDSKNYSKKTTIYTTDDIFYQEVGVFVSQGYFYTFISSLHDVDNRIVYVNIPSMTAKSTTSRARLLVSDYRATKQRIYDETIEFDVVRDNMVDRPIDYDYLQEAFSNGSHVVFATLRRKYKIPFQDILPRETQWCRATEIDVRDGKASGFVTSFDCYTGIHRRQYMHAFYPDGSINIQEQANACSSPTVMMFPYEGMINVEIEDPIYPLTYPTTKQKYHNPRGFHKPGEYVIKPNANNIEGMLYDPPIHLKQELPSWNYNMSYSNYQWKDMGAGSGYEVNNEMRRHANRVVYARFNYDDGTFGNFELASTKTLDLEPIYGDVHQIVNYKNSIIILQDRCVTTALPDLPVLLQDANRAKIEAGQPAMSQSGVVIGSSEIFTMKGQPTSLYGCSQDGATAYYATADHIYWFDSFREAICVFTAEGVKNVSVGTATAGWARQVARLVRDQKGYVTLYENRDSTLRIAYHGSEIIMPKEFPFGRSAKRQVIELCEKTMTFSSFISANYKVAAKLHGGNVFFHKDPIEHKMWILDEAIFNGFYMPISEQGEMYVTAPITPDPEHMTQVNFLGVMLFNTGEFVKDFIVEGIIAQGNYFDDAQHFSGAMASSANASQFGNYWTMGLAKNPKLTKQSAPQTFRGNTMIIGLKFATHSPVEKSDWNLSRMKDYYINQFKIGVDSESTVF